MRETTITEETLYREMQQADDAFHAAVVRQFGKRNAGTMRYMGSKHNAATAAAARKYWEASASWLDARRAARG